MVVTVEQFGKDHWSLLAYVESCVVEGEALDYRRMRCNPESHPLLAGTTMSGLSRDWKLTYGTFLKGGQLADHDDVDCLDDLEAAGFVTIYSLINGFVALTDKGLKVAQEIRKHKTNGGRFATFQYQEIEC